MRAAACCLLGSGPRASWETAAGHRRRVEQRSSAFDHVRVPTWGEVRDRAASSEPWTGDDHLRIDAGAPVEQIVVQVLARLRAG